MSQESTDEIAPVTSEDKSQDHGSLDFFSDVSMEVAVEFGNAEVLIRNILSWKVGDIVGLQQDEGQPLQIRVNGRTVGVGEAVVVNDRYGIRVTAVRDPELK